MSETEKAKIRTSGSGTVTGYSVEARYAYPSPEVIAGQIMDERWREVRYEQSAHGVPEQHSHYHPAAYGLHSFEAAEALRWWFVAAARMGPGRYCLETRLVEHRVAYSFSAEVVGPCNVVDGHAERDREKSTENTT